MMCRLSAFWLGKSPATFYQLYTGAAVFLFATRLFIYRSKKWGALITSCTLEAENVMRHAWKPAE